MSKETYPFKIGNFECIAVCDGTFTYTCESFFSNASKEHLEQVLREHNIHRREIITPWTCLFINTGQNRVLIDTGAGVGIMASKDWGKLLKNLQAAGVKAADIDTVILTHCHPDHIGGNTDADGKPAFPNARYVMWKDEWEFWMSEPDLAQLETEEEFKQLLLMFVQKNLPPIQDQLDLIDREMEILPGVNAIAAAGHTPGHMALSISSGGEQLLHISDAVLNPVHLEQLDWHPVYDLLPEQAMATKRQLLDRAASEKTLVFGFHFPFPGLGRIIKKEKGYQWQPIQRLD